MPVRHAIVQPLYTALIVQLVGCAAGPHPILRANERLVSSIADRDMATLETLVAPDFRFEAEDGSAGDRKVWLGSIRDLPYPIESIKHLDLELTISGDQATLCGVQQAQVLVDGETLVDRATFCDRWRKRGDQWLIVFAGMPSHNDPAHDAHHAPLHSDSAFSDRDE